MKVILLAAALGMLTWMLFVLWDHIRKKKTANSNAGRKPGKPIIRIDYGSYRLSLSEFLPAVLLGCITMFGVGYLFFKSVWAAAVLCTIGLTYPRIRAKQLLNRRKTRLNVQFKQLLYSLSSSLSAGRSVENAFQEAAKDLSKLYPSPETYIRVEVERINKRVSNGENLETALQEFSQRTQLEDIGSFCEVFAAGKRSGVNLIEVIRRTANMIADKLEIQQEISVLVAQKKLESKVLILSPLIIISLLSFSSADYMDPLYKGVLGPVLMALCLLGFTGSFLLAQKIMDIKV